MRWSEFGINANEFDSELPAVINTASSLTAQQNSFATLLVPSDWEHLSQLQVAIHMLEIARVALTVKSENFQGDQAVALNAINRAVQDVQLAIETDRGYSVICLLDNGGECSS